jgi:hypothetical protein
MLHMFLNRVKSSQELKARFATLSCDLSTCNSFSKDSNPPKLPSSSTGSVDTPLAAGSAVMATAVVP